MIKAALIATLPLAANAQSVTSCVDAYPASIAAVAEPLKENTRAFANGAIRLTIMDTEEPACCSFYVAVVYPNPEGYADCALVSYTRGFGGFSGLRFSDKGAQYDPARGLTIPFETTIFDGTMFGPGPTLSITVNQATSRVTATLP